MNEKDQYGVDEDLMDELGGAMDEFDTKKLQPIVTITVAVDKGDHKEPDGDEGALPTPEEMEELEKAMG